jgi:SAM-dependent methyltransferase
MHPPYEARLQADVPFVAGTGIIGGLVPPIASAPVRRLAGHESVVGYFVQSDTWAHLVSRFLKERSRLLEIGCGCGDVARLLSYHPYLSRYVGLDHEEASLEWCRAAIQERAPEKFQFNRLALFGTEGVTERPASPAEPDASVDLVLARAIFGLLDGDEARSLLGEVRRVLCPNGIFLVAISVGACGDPAGAIHPDRFQEMAEDAGFRVYQRMELLGEAVLFLLTPPAADRHVLTDEMLRLNHIAAGLQDVLAEVHADDFIYWFCIMHPHLSLERGISYYFQDGANSARKLADLVAGLEDLDQNSVKLLEFASGYGCVARHLKRRPQFELVSCDIHPQALEFLSRTLGVRTLASSHDPADFAPPERFDVVFALSFFSHMPRRTFGPWLRALFRALHDPGYLIFTTLGLRACKEFGIEPEDFPADGFWFEARSEQHDLDGAEYGMTVVTPEFVRAEVERQTGAPIVLYKHVGWWDNQDLWVVKRDS